jgi:predicted dehydrogenase
VGPGGAGRPLTDRALRVAVIGCGFIGGAHSRALRALHHAGEVDAPVVAVCDVDRERAGAFAVAHGGAVATTDAAAAMDAADVVWICTPTSTHRGLVEQAVERGLAVYCEKPLATRLPDAVAMTAAVHGAGVPHQVGLVLRASSALQEVARLVGQAGAESGAPGPLGRAMTAILRDDQFFPISGHYGSTWRADVAVAGGGTLLEHSVHDLDLLRWLLGPVERVTAMTANFAGHPGVEDLAVATLAHAGGAVSSLISVWHEIMSRPSTRRLEVFCERGLVWLDDEQAGPVHVQRDGGSEVIDTTGQEERFLAALGIPEAWRRALRLYLVADRDFLACLASGRRPTPGFDDALVAHELADAAYRSAAQGGQPLPIALS